MMIMIKRMINRECLLEPEQQRAFSLSAKSSVFELARGLGHVI